VAKYSHREVQSAREKWKRFLKKADRPQSPQMEVAKRLEMTALARGEDGPSGAVLDRDCSQRAGNKIVMHGLSQQFNMESRSTKGEQTPNSGR
jgi:hypothetical protein